MSIAPRRPTKGGLIIVGDPKQSIYRFRGADVFAYLGASAHRDNVRRLSLKRNYRSKPALVRAVNAVFKRVNPFLRPEQIQFEEVQAATRQSDGLRTRDQRVDPRPFQLRLFPGAEDGKSWNKGDLNEVAAERAADEIAQLLTLARDRKATLKSNGNSKVLVGGDIAVLVRTGNQGRTIARKLRVRGVQSVEMGIDSVFATLEAGQLRHVLRALAADPAEYNFTSLLRGALATDLFGLGMRELAELQDDDDTWARWSAWARDSHRTWDDKGIATLIRRLLFAEETNCAARLLEYPDGTRRLTNVLHLTELMQQAEAAERLSPQGLVDWLARAAAHPESTDEGTQLRLESDEHLVKIVTIHRSKGLEFPVVFCPFAWDGSRKPRTAKTAEYHEHDGSVAVVDLNPSADAVVREWIEEQADELRLLYVALTRAKYHCVVSWARVNYGENAPLAWLIHGRELAADGTLEAQLECQRGTRQGAGQRSLARGGAAVRKRPARCHRDNGAGWPKFGSPASVRKPGASGIRTPSPPGKSIAPSSAYASGPAFPPSYPRWARPGHPQSTRMSTSRITIRTTRPSPKTVRPNPSSTKRAPRREPEDLLDPFTFPSGFRAGNCLHEIFETKR